MKLRTKILLLLTCISLLLMGGCGQKQEEVMPVEDETPAPIEETEEEVPSYDIIPESYAYSLTVSINPLVELYFDAENTVVGVAYLNEDAVVAYKETELVGKTMDEGVGMLIVAAEEKGYLKEEATVEIEIAKVSEETAIESTLLLDASRYVSQTVDTINEEKESNFVVTVAMSVDKSVQEATGISAPVVCEDCHGTGNDCDECNGTGIVNCKRCVNGLETCGICNGTAVITCHGCHGAGGSCNYCGGSGKMACDACNGQGGFLCSWCAGALRHICPMCWDEGSCATCGGDGIL